MTRRILTLLTLIAVAIGVTPIVAHEELRVVGTVTKVQSSNLEVKTKEGKTFSIVIDKQTAVTRDEKKTDISQIEKGQSIVVDAFGGSDADLLALEIRIVPAIAPSRAK